MDNATELLEAAKALLQYLDASTDREERINLKTATQEEVIESIKRDREKHGLGLPRAEQLRLQARRIEERDAAIQRFRAAVALLK